MQWHAQLRAYPNKHVSAVEKPDLLQLRLVIFFKSFAKVMWYQSQCNVAMTVGKMRNRCQGYEIKCWRTENITLYICSYAWWIVCHTRHAEVSQDLSDVTELILFYWTKGNRWNLDVWDKKFQGLFKIHSLFIALL